MSRDELLERREELLELYNKETRKSKKAPLLTKKERKILGIGKDQGKAVAKHVRISPRKVKIVLDLIKGKDIDEAYSIIRYTPKAASEILYKLLKSAEANAVNNNELNRDALYVYDTYATPGPILKRMMPAARGRGNRINKRTSHITMVVKER
jgi:large subunit ribosomal protein L22